MDKVLILINQQLKGLINLIFLIVLLVSVKHLVNIGFDMPAILSLIHVLGADHQNLSSLYGGDKNGYYLCTGPHFVDIGCKCIAIQYLGAV